MAPARMAVVSRRPPELAGECCGIFGGTRTDFIRHYAGRALRMAFGPRNRERLDGLPGKEGRMIVLEQFLLSACLDYHAGRAASPFADVRIGYVFDRLDLAYSADAAEAAGFTHLAAGAKRDRRVCRDLEWQVSRPTFRNSTSAAAGRWHTLPPRSRIICRDLREP